MALITLLKASHAARFDGRLVWLSEMKWKWSWKMKKTRTENDFQSSNQNQRRRDVSQN